MEESIQDKINWSLDQKVLHSLDIISVFRNSYPKSVIMYSGGIDSEILRELCFPTIILSKSNKMSIVRKLELKHISKTKEHQ